MSEAVVAKRYADALVQLGNEKGLTDQFYEDLKVIKEVFRINMHVLPLLQQPSISNEEKEEFIFDSFQGLAQDIINTLKLLVRRNRVELIGPIVEHYIEMVNDAKGIANGVVYSVKELDEAACHKLEETLAKRFHKQSVSLKNIVDPTLIGGLKIRVGNTILDGSISGKLHRMKRNIKTAN